MTSIEVKPFCFGCVIHAQLLGLLGEMREKGGLTHFVKSIPTLWNPYHTAMCGEVLDEAPFLLGI